MPPLASRSPPHPELVEGRSGGNDDPMDATREVILGPVPRISFLSSSDERMMTRRVHQRCTAPPRSSFDGRTLTRAAQDERYSAVSGLALMVSRAATRPVRRTTSATLTTTPKQKSRPHRDRLSHSSVEAQTRTSCRPPWLLRRGRRRGCPEGRNCLRGRRIRTGAASRAGGTRTRRPTAHPTASDLRR